VSCHEPSQSRCGGDCIPVCDVSGDSTFPPIAGARRDPGCPENGSLSASFNSDNRFGIVDIEVVGLDLVDEITTALHRMRRSGAEPVQWLPANQPALATIRRGPGGWVSATPRSSPASVRRTTARGRARDAVD
jgi:hypothetical protein